MMKNQRIIARLTVELAVLTLAMGQTCEMLREEAGGTLFPPHSPSSGDDKDDTTTTTGDSSSSSSFASLKQGGYVDTLNDVPLDQLDGTEFDVGSTYVFDISHSDGSMNNALLAFELDWSSMAHTYSYDSLETINGTLRVVGEHSLRVAVSVDQGNNACSTYVSDTHTFQVLPTAETLMLDDPGTQHACNICGFPNAQASSSLVLHPDYSLELPCQEWQTYGIEGRLTPAACQFILKDPGLAAICGCRHGTADTSSGGASSTYTLLAWTWLVFGMALYTHFHHLCL